MNPVRLTRRTAMLPFNGCEPEYIRTVCHGACCRSSIAPSGIIVTIHPSEEEAIRARGGEISNGFLQPKDRRCPFQNEAQLCDLHGSGAKPFGCSASPFTLAPGGRTLIVRNRYRLLKCYNDGRRIPAYRAFRGSLDLIFGEEGAHHVCAEIEAGGDEAWWEIPDEIFALLTENDAAKRKAKEDGRLGL